LSRPYDGSPVYEAPWPHWPTFGEAEKEAVAAVLDSGWVVAHHDPERSGEVEAFEEQFASWIGAEHAMGVGNGTKGLNWRWRPRTSASATR
jgi:dTDP-4-amino-4,6-dideoxygalactose transaminase